MLISLSGVAQNVRPADFRFEHLTVDQGLSHSDAMAVTQDRDGFIWVGTNRGINRYDGYQLKSYKLPINPRNGLPSNRIKVLFTAPNGQLWVGAERAGLMRYDPDHDRFSSLGEQQVPGPDRNRARELAQCDVTALATDSQHRLWVGTQQRGLFVLTFGPQGRVLRLQQLPSPLATEINSLVIDGEDQVWVGTPTAGLLVVRANNPALLIQTTDFGPRLVRSLCLDPRGDLWVGTAHQVLWVPAANRRARHQLDEHPLPQALPLVLTLHLDSFGRLWAGTINGLYVWEAGAITGAAPPVLPNPTLILPQDNVPYSLNSERVHQLYEDRNQVLWLCASAGGLNKVDLRQKNFGSLRRQLAGPVTPANNYINTIYKEEATNTLWLGTRNGLAAYDLTHHTFRNYLTQSTDATRSIDVSAIFQATDGTLWFGTRSGSLATLRRPAGGGPAQLKRTERLARGFDLAGTGIEHIAQDGQGTIWLATFERGLLRLSPDGRLLGQYGRKHGGLPSDQFTYLLYDADRNVLWASTHDAGLLKLRPTADSLQLLARYYYAPGQPNSLQVNYVWPLLLDPTGALWIGTIGGGLYQLTTDAQGHEQVRSFIGALPETDVESLLVDDAGNLWLGGTGLYRYSPRTRQYLRFDVADGLQSNAFKISSAARGQDGMLYFGGINGLNYFQPAAIQANPRPPVVQLTELRVLNRPVTVGEPFNGRVLLPHPLTHSPPLTIQASENDFSVEFVALNYVNSQRTQYAYRLLGYQNEWVSPGPGQRLASFTNLPSGHYTLQVKASNGEGVWSRTPATLQLDVLAPWYKTGWAYLLYALAVAGAVALYRRVEMTQQQLKSKLVLEQFQAEKDKELINLKLGFFTNVSHEFRTPLTLILGPIEDLMRGGPVTDLRGKLQLMQQQASKLLELANQLLDFRKVESGHVPLRASYGDATRFLTDLYAVFALKAREREVDYVLDAPTEPVMLYFDRSKLEIILTNLLANAFKYTRTKGRVTFDVSVVGSPAGEAKFEDAQLVGNYLKVSISDTGVGIAKQEQERIFDPYYQASHTSKLRIGGTGIGLALARQFTRRHGGQLTVASIQGVGTTFELRLPFGRQHLQPEDVQAISDGETTAEVELPALDELALPLSETTAQSVRSRLLVVEDNDELREYLRQLFAADYQVTVAEDGVVGWEQALSQLPDLIISDVMMPRSDGLELCQRLKQNPKTSHIPVVLLTARTAETHELEGLGVGADDYVSKPFSPMLLHAKAETLLRNRRKLHEYYDRQILLQPTELVVPDADRQFLEAAMAAVEQHLGDADFGVIELSSAMAMSQSAFYRRLKSLTGQTAVEFIRDVRLKRAAQLLAQSQLRIAEIAFEVGITDTNYFRKIFQKRFGQTPSDYASQHRASPAAT
ncbi:two-component regulator propeller domain-containing protein [Hymenobacter sp. M29]|uniref:histidine kinase n=1 Tax=Hymenobacter mellowenesis TaxID=3063995 RepID=A0ABT9AF86_9BACT|nr:two-component regulator propeller domain-containing protein [Hymenobacter sp. M29]MDO7848484.1 two-component regulator propeller domain-containing protein [Hymenobacter sp. M29]